MADFTHEALKDEIVLDPESIGYKNTNDAWTGGPNPTKPFDEIAGLANEPDLVIDRATIPMEDARAAATFEAYDSLSIDEQEWIRWVTPNGGALRITPDVKLQLSGRTPATNGVAGTGADSDSFWAAAHDQDMAPLYLSMIEKAGSRAEVLWGEGCVVTENDVVKALNIVESGG